MLLPKVDAFDGSDLTRNESQTGTHRLRGLMQVSVGRAYTGSLTNWTKEETILHHYFRHSENAFSICVDKVWECVDEERIHIKFVKGPLNTSRHVRLDFHPVAAPMLDLSRVTLVERDPVESEYGQIPTLSAALFDALGAQVQASPLPKIKTYDSKSKIKALGRNISGCLFDSFGSQFFV